MALFFDGFDQFARNTRPEQLVRLADYTLEGAPVMVAGRKTNSYALALYRAAMSRNWLFSGALMSVGFAVKFDARGPLVAVRAENGDTNLLTLACDTTSGLLNLNGSVGYVNPLKSRWYYVELELDKTANEARVYINGKPDVTVALPAGLTPTVTLRLNPYEAGENDFGTRLFDDFYINDGARLNPLQVTTRFPSADVHTDWNVTGATAHFAAVTSPVDMLDKFIYATVDDVQDTFTSNVTLPDGNPVTNLQLITLFRKATADPMSLELNIDNQKVTVANIGRDWSYRYTLMNPDGYTADNILTSEFGVRLKL